MCEITFILAQKTKKLKGELKKLFYILSIELEQDNELFVFQAKKNKFSLFVLFEAKIQKYIEKYRDLYIIIKMIEN